MSHFKIVPQYITGRMRQRAKDVMPEITDGQLDALYDALYHASPIQTDIGPIGDGSPHKRFSMLMEALQKRFPHPRPFDSTRVPEAYALDAIDDLIERTEKPND